MIYSGYAAGAFYNKGNGANTQCLPKDPKWRKFQDTTDSASSIYGAEYQTQSYSVGELLHKEHLDYDVPCAVCQSQKRFNVYMLPAKDECGSGWHLEYRGYLMSQAHGEQASIYLCVDAHPDVIGLKTNHTGRTFYLVEAKCGSLPCPPYVNGRELTCAVCTS